MSESMADALTRVVQSVGKEWRAAKQRADREDRVRERDLARLRGSEWRTTIKEVAFRVMEAAYLKASGGGRYPANARQIYYAARPAILAAADADSLDSQYFTQELLKSYLEQYRPDWDVVYDARGHFSEPHQKEPDRQPPVGLGGAEVRDYAARFSGMVVTETPTLRSPRLIPTVGPSLRFGGVLFVEKEVRVRASQGGEIRMQRTATERSGKAACCPSAGRPIDEAVGSLATDYKTCGRPSCRCATGHLHGPYYSRRWRDGDGRQRRQYVPREKASEVRSALAQARQSSPAASMRQLRQLEKMLAQLGGEGTQARQRAAAEQGRYWHGRALRERRAYPAEMRDRTTYRLNRAAVVAAVGWEISEDDYVELQRMIRSERKPRNRLGLPWRTADPVTGELALALELDLRRLPSYQAHLARTGGSSA